MVDMTKYKNFRFISCTTFKIGAGEKGFGVFVELIKNDVLEEYIALGWELINFIQRDEKEHTGIVAILGHKGNSPPEPE